MANDNRQKIRRRRYPAVDTLVAVMTNTPDFVLAQKEHWYRIPCRSAPELLPSIQWLAFYHTAAFREAKWAVHYVAPVHAIDRMLRRDLLPEQADHVRAFEPYFRLRIGELERLEHSVPSARQRRIVFIPTTLVKLRAALEINDLYHESPLEDQLWTAFRHNGIAAERQYFVREQQTSYCLDFAVLCADGGVDVECDGDSWHLRREAVVEDNARNNLLARLGWRVLRFSTQELADPQMATTVGIIRATANQLGGIELPERVNRMFGRAATVADQLRLW